MTHGRIGEWFTDARTEAPERRSDTVEQGKEQNTVEQLVETAEPGIRTTLALADALDADGKKAGRRLIIERHRMIDDPPRAPERAATERREHVFASVGTFIDYLTKYRTPDTVVLASVGGHDNDGNEQAVVMTATLDEKAAHGVEVVECIPRLHPMFAPWHGMLGRRVTLADFLVFIRANRKAVVEPDGREFVRALSQVTAATSITLHQGKGRDSLNGILVRTRVQGQDATGTVDLPESVTIQLPVFVDEGPVKASVDLYLSVTGGGDGVAVELSSADLNAMMQEAIDAMVERVRDTFGAGNEAVVGYGAPQWAPWKVLADPFGKSR